MVTIKKIHTVAAEDSITELKLLVLQAQQVRTICVYAHNRTCCYICNDEQ